MKESEQKKPSKTQEELEKITSKAQEYLNNWKRERADFINYKKNEEQRLGEIIKYSSEGMVLEMVNVMDNFMNVTRHLPDNVREKNKDWVEGLEKAMAEFEKLLKGYGVSKIEVKDAKFDPMLHEAVEMTDKDGQRLEEVRAGYKLHEKVIRPARVKIIK